MKKRLRAISIVLVTLLSFSGCPAVPPGNAPGPEERSPASSEPGDSGTDISAPVISTPVISTRVDASGLWEELTISCATSGAAISYSLDDGESWLAYPGPVAVYQASSIQAMAIADGMDSKIATAGRFVPRGLVVPFVFCKDALASIRSSSSLVYSTAATRAPGTWRVYEKPIDLSKETFLAVTCGIDGKGHPAASPETLPNGVTVAITAAITATSEDWSTYSTDLWLEFSGPMIGSATCNGKPCTLEQPEPGNSSLWVIRAVSPGVYGFQLDGTDSLFFRFLYISGNATVGIPIKPLS